MTLPDLNALTLPELYDTLTQGGLDQRLFELARDEDLGLDWSRGDITSMSCLAASNRAQGNLVSREALCLAGMACIPALVRIFAPEVRIIEALPDGTCVEPRTRLAHLAGPQRQLLALERTLLNVVSRLSGIATLTRQYVIAASEGSAGVFDTRKTTPGWRAIEKYAVRCGGGMCHRVALFDAVLIKDNHLSGVGLDGLVEFVTNAAAAARRDRELRFVQVECDTLEQAELLLGTKPGLIDILLLDNMSLDELRSAVELRNARHPSMELEASGGVTLATISDISKTGVDRISVGALTHSARSVDIALDMPH